MRDHTKLRAFVLADDIAVSIYEITATFPREEAFGLTSQMRRAAVSVPSNIVEGCARDSHGDYLRFLYMAFGSLRELHYQFDLSKRLGLIKCSGEHATKQKLTETEKVLNGLIRALKKKG